MMTDNTQKKILLALDGSENSLEIVKYAAKIPAFREMATVLYNVRSEIPEGYWDLEKKQFGSLENRRSKGLGKRT
jgi:nucleotide-binding universal stress UspA family protein